MHKHLCHKCLVKLFIQTDPMSDPKCDYQHKIQFMTYIGSIIITYKLHNQSIKQISITYIPHERTATWVVLASVFRELSDWMHWISISCMWFASRGRSHTLRFSPGRILRCFLYLCMIITIARCWDFDEGTTIWWFTECPWSPHRLHQLRDWTVRLLFLTSYTLHILLAYDFAFIHRTDSAKPIIHFFITKPHYKM